MKYLSIICTIFLAASLYALHVESGNTALDVSAESAVCMYGPYRIMQGEFYLAHKGWGTLYPKADDAHETVVGDGTVSIKPRNNKMIRSEMRHTATPDGVRIDVAAEILPNSGAAYAVIDCYLPKDIFANAAVKRDGMNDIALDPSNWTTIDVTNVTLALKDADWVFTFSSDRPNVTWKLRSVCDRPWGPEDRKTFTFLYQYENIPANGTTIKASIEARCVPKPGYIAAMETRFTERSSAYLQKLLTRYGRPMEPLTGSAKERLMRLTKDVCAASANLDDGGIDRKSGTVIPEPKSYRRGSGIFSLPNKVTVACDAQHDAAFELIALACARFGVTAARVESSTPDAALNAAIIIGVPPKDTSIANACRRFGVTVNEKTPGAEGYALSVTTNGVLIAGSDDAGVIYGAQTFRQLIRRGVRGAELGEAVIIDVPDIKFRGFYVEGGAKIGANEETKRLIRDTFSYFKANAVMLEIRWDALQWKSHPEAAAKNALTLAEFAELADYARRYNLEVIPAVFTYGKMQNLLSSHPEIAEDPDWKKEGHGKAYCPNKPETYTLIFDIMQELADVTKCRRMHIGHDEIAGMKLCGICTNMDAAYLFADDVNKIAGWLADRNVETMIWGDFLLEQKRWTPLGAVEANSGSSHYGGHIVHPAVGKIRKDVIITDWHYNYVNNVLTNYPTFRHFAENGYRVIGCPWFKTENNYYTAREIAAIGAMGVLTTDWGFLGTRQPGANSMMGVAAAWNTGMTAPSALPWSPAAVFAAAIHRCDSPSRMSFARFTPIALDGVATHKRMGDASSWFGLGMRRDLSFLPGGNVRLFGIDYQIGETCIVVGKANGATRASAPALPVNMTAKSLVFLQAMHVEQPEVKLQTYGIYRITYANGETTNISIDGKNITHWLTDSSRKNPWQAWDYAHTWNAALAWEGCTPAGEAVNLQAYEWINPKPDAVISSVEMRAQQNIPGLMIGLAALTAVR
ncbi:MAG: family 20 glycosylhydrolase [Spirochaetes bacterium]|nr:family 20 glycosylhydrolase [Spirochaetota bacterium]